MAELSSDQQFQAVLAVAENQFKKKEIQVRFGPQGKMRFIIDEAGLKPALVQFGVDENVFREIFHSEIGPLLEAIIRGKRDEYIENAPVIGLIRDDAQKRATNKAILQGRFERVNKVLATNELRARYLIKASSKHPRLRNLSWEVAKKIELSTKESWLQPYATLSFETIQPEQALGIFSWFPFFPSDSVGRSEVCAFDCDYDDLDDLIQMLQDAKIALGKAIL